MESAASVMSTTITRDDTDKGEGIENQDVEVAVLAVIGHRAELLEHSTTLRRGKRQHP